LEWYQPDVWRWRVPSSDLPDEPNRALRAELEAGAARVWEGYRIVQATFVVDGEQRSYYGCNAELVSQELGWAVKKTYGAPGSLPYM
jgi:hypothetical protein